VAPTTTTSPQQASQTETQQTPERPAAGPGLSLSPESVEQARREYGLQVSPEMLERTLRNDMEGAKDPTKNIGITNNVFEQSTQERIEPRKFPMTLDRTLPTFRKNEFQEGLQRQHDAFDVAIQNTGVGTFADTMAHWDALLPMHSANYASFLRVREPKTNPDGSARVGLTKEQAAKYAGLLPEQKDVEEIRQDEERNAPKNRQQVDGALQEFRKTIESVALSNGMTVGEASQKAQQLNQEVDALMKQLGPANDAKAYSKERAEKWQAVLQKAEEARQLQELVDGRYQRAVGAIKAKLDREDVYDNPSKNVPDAAQAKMVRDKLGRLTEDGRARLEEEVAYYQGKLKGVEKSLNGQGESTSVASKVRMGIDTEAAHIANLLRQDSEKEREKKGNVGTLSEDDEKKLKEYVDEIQKIKGSIGKVKPKKQ